VFKTNLLLCHDGGGALDLRRTLALVREAALRSCGATSLPGLRAAGAGAAAASLMQGVVPHAVGNIGPDVVCMGAARAAYKLLTGAAAASD